MSETELAKNHWGISQSPIMWSSVPGADQFVVRTSQNVRIGPLHVAIRSNETSFSELKYFPRSVRDPKSVPVHYTVNCCNSNIDGPWPMEDIRASRDKSYRSGRFAAGYYLTDHFGKPAYLMTRGTELWIVAQDFGSILWPFVVKHLLTLHAIDHGLLHLKAAAVRLGETVTLLVGRGGTGKTVLLTQLCQVAGAEFLCNTHLLVNGGIVEPVFSAMRVRKDALFGPIIASKTLPAAIKSEEFLADPCADFGWRVAEGGPVRNICLLDYKRSSHAAIEDLSDRVLFNYMENFSIGPSIYGQREDVLDHLGGNVQRLSVEWSLMRANLRALVSQCRRLYVSCDVMDPKNLRAVCDRIGAIE